MDGHVLLLVLAAALLHATWNSIVKGGSNKLFESSMNALGGGLGALLILPFLPAPAPASPWKHDATAPPQPHELTQTHRK